MAPRPSQIAWVARNRRGRRGCDGAEHRSRVFVDLREVRGDDVGQDRRDVLPREVRGDELLGEERVPLTACDDRVDERLRRRLTRERGNLLDDLASVEAGK